MKNKGDLVYVALIALFVGQLTGYYSGADARIDIPSERLKFALDALTAFGTVAAVIVALWLGLKNARDTRAHERLKGRMACSLLAMRLQRAYVDLWGVGALLSSYNDEGDSKREYLSLPQFGLMDAPLASELTVETLAVIAGISDQAAVDLGLAVSRLKLALNWRDMHRAQCPWNLYEPSNRRMITSVLRSHVFEAARSFGAASSEMLRLTKDDHRRSDERMGRGKAVASGSLPH
jgi:hypothetical protein